MFIAPISKSPEHRDSADQSQQRWAQSPLTLDKFRPLSVKLVGRHFSPAALKKAEEAGTASARLTSEPGFVKHCFLSLFLSFCRGEQHLECKGCPPAWVPVCPPPPPPRPRVLAQKLVLGLPGKVSFLVDSLPLASYSARWTLVFKNSYLFA